MNECRIFLSAVTSEFGPYRDEIARLLRTKGCIVKVQEEFQTGSGRLLDKLHNYIQSCHVVICLLGDRYGAEPPQAESTRFTFSFAKSGGGTLPRHSYTQWEYLLGRRMNKSLFVFLSGETAKSEISSKCRPEPKELKELQANFIKNEVRLEGIDRSKFESLEQLKDQINAIDFNRLAWAQHHQAELKPNCPYVGLRHFRETDRDYLFGRDELIIDLLSELEQRHFLLTLGSSGCGKSSVLRGGVIPLWREKHAENDKVIIFNPDEDIFTSLFSGLLQAGYSQAEARLALQPTKTVLRDCYRSLSTHGEHWLIFIDQFEEIFSRTPDKPEHQKKLKQFISSLIDVATDSIPELRIVLAMRDDFFSNLEGFRELCNVADGNFRRVTPMSVADMRSVIQNPAAAHGVSFEPGLVEQILRDVEDPQGRLPLPLLQYTLAVLWNEEDVSNRVLNFDSYKSIGGVKGALQKKVSEYYQSLNISERHSLRRILLRLVDIGEKKVPVSQGTEKAEFLKLESDRAVLDQLLTREKLLVAKEGVGKGKNSSGIIELAHEALISEWSEFKKWIDESREAIGLRNRIQQDSEIWEKYVRSPNLNERSRARDELWAGSRLERISELENEGELDRIGGLNERENRFLSACLREKRRKMSRLKLIAAVTSATALLSIATTVLAITQGQRLVKEREIVVRQKSDAEIQAARGFILRAEKESKSSDAAFYAGRALGFDEFGIETLPQPSVAAPSTIISKFRKFLGLASRPSEEPSTFPSLIPVGHPLRNMARHKVENSSVKPFLWTSPVDSQHIGVVNTLDCSPDGQHLLSASGDGGIKIWDLDSGNELIKLTGHNSGVLTCCWSPDGRNFATGSYDQTIKIWDKKTASEVHTLNGHSDSVSSLSWSHDGTRLASSSDDFTIKIWDTKSWEILATLNAHTHDVSCVSWSPNDQTLASGSQDNEIILWNTSTWAEDAKLLGHSAWVIDVDWSPDGTHLVSGSTDKTIMIWDAATKQKISKVEFDSWVLGLDWSPDKNHIAVATQNGVTLVDTDKYKKGKPYIGHHDDVTSVSWAPDGRRLASGSQGATIRVWSPFATESENWKPKGQRTVVNSVSWSHDTRWIASGSTDSLVRVWDMKTGDLKHELLGHQKSVTSLDWNEQDLKLASSSIDGTIKIWNPETGENVASLSKGRWGGINEIDWSPDGKVIAAASNNDSVELYDVEKKKYIHALEGHEDDVLCVHWSPDGKVLASGSDDNVIILWDVPNQKLITTLRGHRGGVTGIAFSPDGRSLASASYDDTLRLWDTSSGESKITLFGHHDTTQGIRWSPNGKLLLSCSSDKTARIWDAQSGDQVGVYQGHTEMVKDAKWSPDGSHFVTGAWDGTLKVWESKISEERAIFRTNGTHCRSVGWTPCGEALAFVSVGINVIEPTSGEIIERYRSTEDRLSSAKWCPRGIFLAATSNENNIYVWTRHNDSEPLKFSAHTREINSIAWSPDGRFLASGSEDSSIRVWNSSNGEQKAVFEGHFDSVTEVVWSPDGKTLASSSEDHTAILWNALTKEKIHILRGHTDWVTGIAWHPNGTQVATCSDDNTIKVWDAETGAIIADFKAHSDYILDLAWNSNGHWLASCSSDRNIILWDTNTWTPSTTFSGHASSITSVSFHPTKDTLASSAHDGTVRLWEFNPSNINLYQYFEEGACSFEGAGGDLTWKEPHRNLYKTTYFEFRSTNPNTNLGLLRRLKDLKKPLSPEIHWQSYLNALLAENWAAALLHYQQLSPNFRKSVHTTVIQATRDLSERISDTLAAEQKAHALQLFKFVQQIISELPEEERERFFLGLAIRMRDANSRIHVLEILDQIAVPSHKMNFLSVFQLPIFEQLSTAENFDEINRVWTEAKLQPELTDSFFEQLSPAFLKKLILMALDSSSVDSIQFALDVSASLSPSTAGISDGSYYRGRSLVKAGRINEGLNIYSQMLEFEEHRILATAGLAYFLIESDDYEKIALNFLPAFRHQELLGIAALARKENQPYIHEIIQLVGEELHQRVNSKQSSEDRSDLVESLGNFAWIQLEVGDFEGAVDTCEVAQNLLEHSPLVWIQGNLATAYLFLGRVEDAFALHREYRGRLLEILDGTNTWEDAIRSDFEHFRSVEGLITPEIEGRMKKVEDYFGIVSTAPQKSDEQSSESEQ